LQSLAVWTKDVPTLLPQADLLALQHYDEASQAVTRRMVVPMADVLRLAPGLLEKVPDLEPPRWQTLGFVEDEAWAALEALQVSLPVQEPDAAS
jgi:hypothetical protein